MPLVVETFPQSLDERLLERRIVAISGLLDDEAVTAAAARLLHLDALSPATITIRLDSAGGQLGAALVLVDTLGAMRAPVHLVVVGQAVGAAAVVVAAADDSSIYPHARVVICEPDLPSIQGDATQVDAEVSRQRRLLDAAYDVIAGRCGRTRAEVAADAQRRLLLTAREAVDFGVVDRLEQSTT